MAYATSNPPVCIVPSVGGGPALWVYDHATDPHTDVDAAGYFTDGAALGLKAYDIMVVTDIDTATTTIHHALNATTVSTATLA